MRPARGQSSRIGRRRRRRRPAHRTGRQAERQRESGGLTASNFLYTSRVYCSSCFWRSFLFRSSICAMIRPRWPPTLTTTMAASGRRYDWSLRCSQLAARRRLLRLRGVVCAARRSCVSQTCASAALSLTPACATQSGRLADACLIQPSLPRNPTFYHARGRRRWGGERSQPAARARRRCSAAGLALRAQQGRKVQS